MCDGGGDLCTYIFPNTRGRCRTGAHSQTVAAETAVSTETSTSDRGGRTTTDMPAVRRRLAVAQP